MHPKHIHSKPKTSTHVTIFPDAAATDFCSHLGNSIVSIVVSNHLFSHHLMVPSNQIWYWLNFDFSFGDIVKIWVGCWISMGDGVFLMPRLLVLLLFFGLSAVICSYICNYSCCSFLLLLSIEVIVIYCFLGLFFFMAFSYCFLVLFFFCGFWLFLLSLVAVTVVDCCHCCCRICCCCHPCQLILSCCCCLITVVSSVVVSSLLSNCCCWFCCCCHPCQLFLSLLFFVHMLFLFLILLDVVVKRKKFFLLLFL